MKFENIRVMNFENAIRGMRNPKNSWHLSDSKFGINGISCSDDDKAEVIQNWLKWREEKDSETSPVNNDHSSYENWLERNGIIRRGEKNRAYEYAYIGPKDMELAQSLIRAGSEHRKFMRQIFVSVDITAPMYWWGEFDTYKVGTVANSTSTMHKLTSKPITLDCFEIDDLAEMDMIIPIVGSEITLEQAKNAIIDICEGLRQKYLETKDKKYWKELVRWLPNGWQQTRTVTMTYENLLAMCSKGQRRFHKLTEWSGDGEDFVTESFIKFARKLPYAQEFIFIDEQSK